METIQVQVGDLFLDSQPLLLLFLAAGPPRLPRRVQVQLGGGATTLLVLLCLMVMRTLLMRLDTLVVLVMTGEYR
jgi:hypothetical protein